MEEVARGWRRVHNDLPNLYASQSIIMEIKSKRMKWVGLTAHMG